MQCTAVFQLDPDIPDGCPDHSGHVRQRDNLERALEAGAGSHPSFQRIAVKGTAGAIRTPLACGCWFYAFPA